MDILEAIGIDLKTSIDDLIYEIKTIQRDIKTIKRKLNLANSTNKKNFD